MRELIELYQESPKLFWEELLGAVALFAGLYVFTVIMFCL